MKSQTNVNNPNGCNLNVNINKDDVDLNDFLFITNEFKLRPCKLIFYSQFDAKGVWEIIGKDYKVVESDINKVSEIIPEGEHFIFNNKYCIKLTNDLYISFLELNSTANLEEDRIITNFTLFYNNEKVSTIDLNKIVHKFEATIMSFNDVEVQDRSFYLKLGPNGYELSPYNTQTDIDNIELYYNDDIIGKGNKLIKQINKNSRGLTIFWGKRGTGKTNFASYVGTQIEKQVIYIPSVMIDATINSPEFITFLERNNDSVILLDDCDMFSEQHHYKISTSLNNIKQMVDGVLSDHLNISVILITNCSDFEDITLDYMDCNSVIANIEFTELDIDKANDLSKFLCKNKIYKKNTKVVDVVKGLKEQESEVEIGY